MGKDAPDPPDYEGLARQEAEASRRNTQYQTRANRPNQYTPYGSSEWDIDPETGESTQNIALNPDSQAALTSQQRVGRDLSGTGENLTGRVAGDLANPVDYDQFREYGDIGDYDERRQGAEDAAYSRAESRLNPYWEQQTGDLDVQLRSQGLVPGDEAYDRAMGNATRARTDAYSAAQDDSVRQGRQESQLAYGQQMGEAELDSTTRQSQISEELQKRGWTINEINSLISGREVGMPGMPEFRGAGRWETPQLMAAGNNQYSAALDQYNAKQAGFQGMMSGFGSLASGGMSFG